MHSVESSPRYSAVVLYYRLGPKIAECLQSLIAQTVQPLEIVVVDNASGDGVLASVLPNFPTVKLLSLSNNGGYAAGMNAGLAALDGAAPYVLFLTHEVVFPPPMSFELLYALESTEAAQAGPVLERRATGEIWSSGGEITSSGRPRHSVAQPVGPTFVDWLDGACLMVTREALNSIGGFDERFFLYWEDVDLAYRMAAAGGSVIVPTAQAAQDTNTTPPYFAARNRVLMWRLHRRPLWVVTAVASHLLQGLLARGRRGRTDTTREHLAGLRAGFRRSAIESTMDTQPPR